MAETEEVLTTECSMSVPQLMEDLWSVSKWHSLGTSLGLDASQLDVIEQEIPAGVDAIQRRKGRVLDTWMRGKTGDPSWKDIVTALMKMGEHSVAVEMRSKYNGNIPVKPVVSKADVIVKESQQQIKGEFVELQMLICDRLQTMQINMPRFLRFIKGLFHCADFIPASKKIDDIFEAISRNGLWDFINYSPLQQIAKAFAKDDEEIYTAIRKYRCALAGYLASTKIAEHIANICPISEEILRATSLPLARNDQSYFVKLTFKLEAKVTEESMDYLTELWHSVSEYLGLPSLTYLLDEIREGCVSVTWLIPPTAMPFIVLNIEDPKTAKKISHLGIIRMEVDDLCLYERQESNLETDMEQQQEQNSSLKQFPDSQEQVQKDTSQDIVKGIAEQDSSSKELPQHYTEEGERSEHRLLDALQKTLSIERKIRKRIEEKNSELRAAIAYKDVKIGQLREKNTGLECQLSQVREELREQATATEETQQLREQPQQTTEEQEISKPDTKNCKAVGHGLQFGKTNQIAQFQVHLTDANGEPCIERQEVSAELKSLVDGTITQAEVSHQTRNVGSYEVSYQPRIRGRHELTVSVNGKDINDSPFRVYVQQPPLLMGRPVRVISGLDRPWRATLSSNGQLIVTEAGSISVFDGQGGLVRSIDSIELQHSTVMLNPTGVAIDENDIIYVWDWNAHKLFKISSTGKVIESVGGRGRGPIQFDSSDAITLRDNCLYVCDRLNHRIQIFSCDLSLISTFGSHGNGEGMFSRPGDIAFDQEGNMYVLERGNHRVQVFSPSGTSLRTFGKYGSGLGELGLPRGIHVDGNMVYITEWENHRVSVFTTLGVFITYFGINGSDEGEFNKPSGITMDDNGFLYVCDHDNCRIQIF